MPLASPQEAFVGALEEFDHRSECSLTEQDLSGISKIPQDGRALLASARHEARRRNEAPASRHDEIEATAMAAEKYGWHVVGKRGKKVSLFSFGPPAKSGFTGPP